MKPCSSFWQTEITNRWRVHRAGTARSPGHPAGGSRQLGVTPIGTSP
jgi:hypothetical protein